MALLECAPMQAQAEQSKPVVIAALYRFVVLDDLPGLQADLRAVCEDAGILGTLLLAPEGINGTVAGSRESIDRLMTWFRNRAEFSDLEWKESAAEDMPFYRMRVRFKKEIVTMGMPGIDPSQDVGTYVEPAQWNDLISDPSVTVVDTRNRYEVHLGSFEGAVDPKTESFRDFPRWVAQNLDPARDTKVAMFCTGGIRCEKATAYLLSQGFEAVYHLRGGILKYLEETPAEQSLWQGECFVFDNRVTVDHDLQPGNHEICFNCRMPLSDEDQLSPQYEKHVSCPHCFERLTPERREGLLERARQVALAEDRGEAHIGRRFPDSEPST